MNKPIFLNEIEREAYLSGDQFGATIRGDRPALYGQRRNASLPSGLRVHTLDARAATDFKTSNRLAGGVVLHVLLEGAADAWVGGEKLLLDGRGQPQMAFYALRGAARFLRQTREGNYLRKATINISWDWLKAHGLPADAIMHGAPFCQKSWVASPDETASAERLVAIDRAVAAPIPAATQIEREALVMSLVLSLITRLTAAPGDLRPAEIDRLQRMESLALRPGPVPNLGWLAAQGGVSESSMQRLFHRAYGQSPLQRVRHLRMTRAQAALHRSASVAEAAHLAGFTCPNSFSTAFRKHFGMPPSAFWP